jgi:hypothetical protein
MVSSIPNNFTVNKQNNPLSAEVVTNNPVQTKSGSLENSPQTDTVSLSNKQPMSKKTKIFLNLGGIATAVIGAVLAVKGYKSHKITKTLDQIEQKFVKLKENVPEAQKTFKDVFLRSDISEKETIEMLDRYKDIEKLGITGTKEEYIQALFNETKQNFRLGKELKLEIEDFLTATEGGKNFCLTDTITMNKKWSRKHLGNAVFHELRHSKQDYFAINCDINKFFKSNGITDTKEKAHELPFLQRKCGLLEFSKENVPSEYLNYVENCYKGYSDYTALRFMPESAEKYELYRNNFLEQDAWNSANKITKFLYNFELK